jgi:hypothetical protein
MVILSCNQAILRSAWTGKTMGWLAASSDLLRIPDGAVTIVPEQRLFQIRL